MEFRKSTPADIDEMMQIVNDAKLLLKKQNINQWQTGYPNRPLLEKDIADGIGYVLCDSSRIAGMCAITFGADESYEKIEGGWKTTGSNY
ncbi:MAG: GNAT family N-acetyltransferase, partial [Alphaproteobacteria bacterium]|nr:GNAT family N-acetyltransferase [Alphaproteobacteria bacterium]